MKRKHHIGRPKQTLPAVIPEVKAEPLKVANSQGLLSAFMGGPQGIGVRGAQVSQDTTCWVNLRWYLVSNERSMISEAYAEIGLVQTVVKVPVEDGLRGGIEIKTKLLSEHELAKLQNHMERKRDLGVMGDALCWARLYGGGGCIIFTNQDPATPLRIDAITEADNLRFRDVDLWELFYDQQYFDGFNPSLQNEDDPKFQFYSYYGVKVHKSRVLRLEGIRAPSYLRPRLRGWGFSVLEILVRSLNQHLKATDLTFEVLDEFKIDVYRMKDLASYLMSPAGQAVVHDRVQSMNLIKNYLNAIVLDKEDEYEQKQLSFAGLAEVAQGIRVQAACDTRMPVTKLWGVSATGFNSGEDDIEVYNAMVESQVRTPSKFRIHAMVELRCQELYGFVPEDLEVSFKPLRVLGAEQEENVKTQKHTRAIQAIEKGLISGEEYREICNKGNLHDIKLDKQLTMPGPAEPGGTMEKEAASKVGPGGEEKGAKEGDPPEAKNPPNQKKPSTQNSIGRYSAEQFHLRIANSAEFDRASYEADGGDSWVDPRRKEFFDRPVGVDEGVWARAKEVSKEMFGGQERWQATIWAYRKLGGTHV